jgi:hypothetical protein
MDRVGFNELPPIDLDKDPLLARNLLGHESNVRGHVDSQKVGGGVLECDLRGRTVRIQALDDDVCDDVVGKSGKGGAAKTNQPSDHAALANIDGCAKWRDDRGIAKRVADDGGYGQSEAANSGNGAAGAIAEVVVQHVGKVAALIRHTNRIDGERAMRIIGTDDRRQRQKHNRYENQDGLHVACEDGYTTFIHNHTVFKWLDSGTRKQKAKNKSICGIFVKRTKKGTIIFLLLLLMSLLELPADVLGLICNRHYCNLVDRAMLRASCRLLKRMVARKRPGMCTLLWEMVAEGYLHLIDWYINISHPSVDLDDTMTRGWNLMQKALYWRRFHIIDWVVGWWDPESIDREFLRDMFYPICDYCPVSTLIKLDETAHCWGFPLPWYALRKRAFIQEDVSLLDWIHKNGCGMPEFGSGNETAPEVMHLIVGSEKVREWYWEHARGLFFKVSPEELAHNQSKNTRKWLLSKGFHPETRQVTLAGPELHLITEDPQKRPKIAVES